MRRRISLLILVVVVLTGGAWRYRVTRPDYRYARGQDAIRTKDAATVGAYADQLEAAGHPDRAHLLRGEALHAFGDPARALAQLNKIPPDSPHHLRAAALSGRCLLDLGAQKEAHRVFSFVVAEQPDNADAHRGLGVIAYDLGQLDDAVEHLRKVAELDPGDARPHRLVGLIYKDMNQNEQSEAAYREALRRGTAAEREVRAELAEVLARQGKFADGLATLDGAADTPDAAAVRAECLRGLGRDRDAAGVLDAALARQETAALYRLRGQVEQEQGRTADAVRSLETAVRLGPNDHQAHYQLVQAYNAAGRKDDAARTLARVEELRGDLDRVTTLTREAMAKPWDAAVRLQLAELSDRMGRPEMAATWRKAAAACSAPGGPG